MLGSAGNVMEAKSGKLYFWGHSKVRRKRKFLYPSHLVISTYSAVSNRRACTAINLSVKIRPTFSYFILHFYQNLQQITKNAKFC